MGGIRTKARGSTVDLIIADENPGKSEVPSEVSEGMNNKLCPPFSFPSKSKISNGPTPADIKGGIPCLPTAKMGSHSLFSGMNSLRKRQDVPVEEDPEGHLGLPKMFSLRELQIATDKFSSNNILGRGGFGEVYKGRLADGSLVAVKRIKEYTSYKGLQFECDVEMKISMMISMAHHRNLIRLRGFCRTRTELLLVYPYMANGNVASCLRERPKSKRPLDWPTRKRIALGSARGLSYLHDQRDPKIIHRDIKPANILLDEEFEAVVGDFGLAILVDCKDIDVTTDSICGTYGYVPPEYIESGICSEKIDVYGYGIMLLELITGHRVFDLLRLANDYNLTLPDWVIGLLKEKKFETVVDPDLQHNYVEAETKQLIQVSLLCTQGSPIHRPKMSEVVRMIEGDGFAKRWDEWQKMEVLRQELELASPPNSYNWIVDSTEDLHAVELSGPR